MAEPMAAVSVDVSVTNAVAIIVTAAVFMARRGDATIRGKGGGRKRGGVAVMFP